MRYDKYKYVIIDASEVSLVDFSQVAEYSENTLGYSLDGSQTIVKFEGELPSFLEGKVIYPYKQIRRILRGYEWCQPAGDDIPEE